LSGDLALDDPDPPSSSPAAPLELVPTSPEAGASPARPGFAVVGAGSLGLVFAAALAASGSPVTVLARRDSLAAVLSTGELRIGGALGLQVPLTAGPGSPGVVGVVGNAGEVPVVVATLLTTKGHDLQAVVDELAGAAAGGAMAGAWFAGFQNGVMKDEVLAGAFGADRVLGAATVLGARRVAAGEVVVAGLGTTYFGELGGVLSPRAHAAAGTFAAAGLPAVTVDDARSLLWSKFANAVGIFGVSVLTRLATGELFARPPLVLAYRSLLDEVDAVARAEGVEIGDYPDLPMRSYLEEDAEEMAERVAARAAANSGPPSLSSMLQDVAAGRPSEAEQIFGDLIGRAARHGVPVPRAEIVCRLVAGIDLGSARR